MVTHRNLQYPRFHYVIGTGRSNVIYQCSRFQSNPSWLLNKLSKAEQIVDAAKMFCIVVAKLPRRFASEIAIGVAKENNFLALSREDSLKLVEGVNRVTWRTVPNYNNVRSTFGGFYFYTNELKIVFRQICTAGVLNWLPYI